MGTRTDFHLVMSIYSSLCVGIYKIKHYFTSKKDPAEAGPSPREDFVRPHVASPQLGPISTSHKLGTSKGTAFSIISAIDFASSRFFTDMAISS